MAFINNLDNKKQLNMIWIIVIAVIGFIIFSFVKDAGKDNEDLKYTSLTEKFEVIVHNLNKSAFNGNGHTTSLDKRSFNLFQNGKNQIIQFQYGTGHLTITWRYKYFQKEIVHEKTYNDVRNLSIFEQQTIAENMIKEMNLVIEKHQNDVVNE